MHDSRLQAKAKELTAQNQKASMASRERARLLPLLSYVVVSVFEYRMPNPHHTACALSLLWASMASAGIARVLQFSFLLLPCCCSSSFLFLLVSSPHGPAHSPLHT